MSVVTEQSDLMGQREDLKKGTDGGFTLRTTLVELSSIVYGKQRGERGIKRRKDEGRIRLKRLPSPGQNE